MARKFRSDYSDADIGIDNIDPRKVCKPTDTNKCDEKYKGLYEAARKDRGSRLLRIMWDFHVLFTYAEEGNYSRAARKLDITHVEQVKRALLRAKKDMRSDIHF